MGGYFSTLAGQARVRIGRLENTEPATQDLSIDGSSVTWLRSGTGPELWQTAFELSTNAVDWAGLGAGIRIPGGWQLTGVSLSAEASIRARGFVAQGYQSSSGWFVESIAGRAAISIQPTSQTNNAGTVASFHVLAGGTPPLTYQWFKEGLALQDGESVSGAQNATLSLSNVLASDSGSYSLLISNASGSVTSVPAILTVLDPAINNPPLGHIVNVGQPLRLSVIGGGTPPLNYQWRKDGLDLAGATESSLVIAAAQWGDRGGYDVRVMNTMGSATSAVAMVEVNMLPPDSFAPELDTSPGTGLETAVVQLDGKVLLGGAFALVAGQPRKSLGRLFADGTLDLPFDANVDGPLNTVLAVGVQEDGRILVGGSFSSLGGQTRNLFGRVNVDGTVDEGFLADGVSVAPLAVRCLAIEADRRILVGGFFKIMGGQPRTNICRLNLDGTAASDFNLGANNTVRCISVQPNGKILVAGTFTELAGQPCMGVGRLNSDGTYDTNFTASANAGVNCLVLQPDGKVVVGGTFSVIGGTSRQRIARLNNDGTADPGFDPGVSSTGSSAYVTSLALQADGKIIVAGMFTVLGGHTRSNLGRLNADGSLDPTFNAAVLGGSGTQVHSVSLDNAGNVLVGGIFTNLAGEVRTNICRLRNSVGATQKLDVDGSSLTWLRGGSAPEISRAFFEASTNGVEWIRLGDGAPVAGGWQLDGAQLPSGAVLRARGYAGGGKFNGSTYIVESTWSPSGPLITLQPDNQTVLAGGSVVLRVGAQGTGLVSYQWYFAGEPLPAETNDTLVISSAQRAHSGAYWAAVTDESGTTASFEARVRVLVPPQLEPLVLLSDGTVRLQFRDCDGALPADLLNVSVQWRSNLPSVMDTNWETLNCGWYVTNGFIVVEDTNHWEHPTRFYRVLEW